MAIDVGLEGGGEQTEQRIIDALAYRLNLQLLGEVPHLEGGRDAMDLAHRGDGRVEDASGLLEKHAVVDSVLRFGECRGSGGSVLDSAHPPLSAPW